jgi:hypothetical protein
VYHACVAPPREPIRAPWRAAWQRVGAAGAGRRRRVADRKAELFRRWVADASDERLEAVMRGPLRPVLMRQILTTMCRRFDGDRGRRVDAVVEFRVGHPRSRPPDRHQLVMARGRCTRSRRRTEAPSLTLALDSVSFLRLVGGSASAPGLLVRGRLRISGDVVLAARLPALMNIPRSPVGRT